MSSPILVTGGSGTLGRLVVPRLRPRDGTSACSAGPRPVGPGIDVVTVTS